MSTTSQPQPSSQAQRPNVAEPSRVVTPSGESGQQVAGQMNTRARTRCPNPDCSTVYSVRQEDVGKKTTCKKCGKPFTIGASVPGRPTEAPERHWITSRRPSARASARLWHTLGWAVIGANLLALLSDLTEAEKSFWGRHALYPYSVARLWQFWDRGVAPKFAGVSAPGLDE